jgi:hypothetical protein
MEMIFLDSQVSKAIVSVTELKPLFNVLPGFWIKAKMFKFETNNYAIKSRALFSGFNSFFNFLGK